MFIHVKLRSISAIFICLALNISADANVEQQNNIIVGAGAHFSWIVFDRMKSELEQISGTHLQLFGKGSMHGIGCNAGIKNALKSSKEQPRFGFVCCELTPEEISEKKLKVYPIVKEPILTVVNKNNPIQNLRQEQIRAIFEGHVTNWNEVGGPDMNIIVIARLHCKDRPGHWKTIVPSHKHFTQQRIDVKSADNMIKKVSELPGAIGHIGSAWDFGAESNVKSISVNGYQPTAQNLLAGKYPFFRVLSAVTNDNPSEEIQKIIHHSQHSKTLRTIAQQYELVPLN